ncbi:MAG: hypothetical protein NTV80_16630 [Verrucomicrobia bacterium]|nr:hypothetical protein [Verrucomicrobiota bacterium]
MAIGAHGGKVEGRFASVIMGQGTIAGGDKQLVIGNYNTSLSDKLFIIGGGSSDTSRTNAMTVDSSGNVDAKGKVKAQSIETSALTITTDTSDISMGAFTAQ